MQVLQQFVSQFLSNFEKNFSRHFELAIVVFFCRIFKEPKSMNILTICCINVTKYYIWNKSFTFI